MYISSYWYKCVLMLLCMRSHNTNYAGERRGESMLLFMLVRGVLIILYMRVRGA